MRQQYAPFLDIPVFIKLMEEAWGKKLQ